MRNKHILKYIYFVCVCLLVYGIRVLIIPRVFFVLNPKGINGGDSLLNALLQYGVLLLGSVLILVKYEQTEQSFFPKRSILKGFYYICLGFLVFYSFQLFTNGIIVFISKQERDVELYEINAPSLGLLVLVQVLWAVLAEEMWYRKCLFFFFPLKNILLKVIFASLIFGLSHQAFDQKFHSFFLSTLLCLIIQKEKSIIPCIIVHGMYNILGISYSFIIHERVGFTLRKLGFFSYLNVFSNGMIYICTALIMFMMGVLLVWKMNRHSGYERTCCDSRT